MSRFQKVVLLLLGFILVAVVALVGVSALNNVPTAANLLPAVEQTNTWAAEFAATHRATLDAIGTQAVATAAAS